MNPSARVSILTGCLVASVVFWSAPSGAASFADLPPEREEVSLLSDRLRIRLPKGADLGPLPWAMMVAPEPPERQLRVVIDSGPLRLVALVTELFRVSPDALAQLGTRFVKVLESDRRFGQLTVVSTTLNVSGLEVLEFEPQGTPKFADANLLKGVVTKHPDSSVQVVYFFVNDPALSDLPAARQLVTDMVASLRPGPRQLPTGPRVQLPGGKLVLDLLPGYSAYRQQGPDFDVYWIQALVALDQPAGRLGIYTGHHPQGPSHPGGARAYPAFLFGAHGVWYVWETPTDVLRYHREVYVRAPGSDVTRHVILEAATPTESADFQRMAETATVQ